ncbi:trihelix transcription factor DF1-like [Amaranthus tricolor]|uniref:trihelix transcription factor DF1-like n=1 Tax=Amaranthus tricolor TaxID=29722 RepID=UPI00258A452C|nr:trihelix transcription factor DF1-like [Amaranthus tricolor]
MLENSEMHEISLQRRENEVGKSIILEKAVEEGKNEENKEDYGVSVAERNSPANRWPKHETISLLEIRSEMDTAFKDSGSKAHLWDEVSRKMAELGYHRSAKKCKEKFENIYKYHRRVKSSSYARTKQKMYRFFDQLEALDHHQISLETSVSEPENTSLNVTPYAATPISSHPQRIPQTSLPVSVNLDSFTVSTSSASTSGSESEGTRMKKRKWVDCFNVLMKSVLAKQEALHNKFLEAIDKHELNSRARDEAWKRLEMDRIKREQELLMQERSISAAKDAAILAFLQKVSEQGKCPEISEPLLQTPSQDISNLCRKEKDNGENSSSRWPKEEVEVLIKIKTNMELEYQKLGPKGAMWEEISMAMKNFGYDRNAKRCKEKWENINKYYRRVKDSNKPRHVDSKTCPYFHLLDTMYNMKTQRSEYNSETSGSNFRPEELLLHMMNNPSKQPCQESVVLQQVEGEWTMQNGKRDQNEEAGNDEASGDFQVVHDPIPMNAAE